MKKYRVLLLTLFFLLLSSCGSHQYKFILCEVTYINGDKEKLKIQCQRFTYPDGEVGEWKAVYYESDDGAFLMFIDSSGNENRLYGFRTVIALEKDKKPLNGDELI